MISKIELKLKEGGLFRSRRLIPGCSFLKISEILTGGSLYDGLRNSMFTAYLGGIFHQELNL